MPPLAKLLATASAALVGGPVLALAIGHPSTVPVWGRPLDVRLKVAGVSTQEAVAECFHVDVFDGDASIPAPQVAWSFDASSSAGDERWLRVRTSRALREPVVTLNVEARCNGRLTRTVTLLPEPMKSDTLAVPVLAEATAEAAPPMQLAAMEPPAAGEVAVLPRALRSRGGSDARPRRQAEATARPVRRADARPHAARESSSQPRLQLSEPLLALTLAGASVNAVTYQPLPAPATATTALSSLPVSPVLPTLPPARSVSNDHLQRELARLGETVRAQQALIARLESRTPVYRFALDPWLTGGAALAAGTAAVLFLRLRRVQRERAPWFDSSVLTYLDETERSRFA